jgi:tetratricopeptide (TPR) repeat protein
MKTKIIGMPKKPKELATLLTNNKSEIIEHTPDFSKRDVNTEEIRTSYNHLKPIIGDTLALLIVVMSAQKTSLQEVSLTIDRLVTTFKKLAESLPQGNPELELEEKIKRSYNFLRANRHPAYTREFISLAKALQQLNHHDGPMGDCNNLGLAFVAIASTLSVTSTFIGDIYHTFVAASHKASSPILIDFGYGNDILNTEYKKSNGTVVHKESGRATRELSPLSMVANMLVRQTMASTTLTDSNKIDAYKEAITLDFKFAEPHNNIADILFKNEQYDRAFKQYDRAVSKEPDNIFFQLNKLITFVFYTQDFRFESIEPGLDLIFELYNGFAEAHYLKFLLTGDETEKRIALKHGYASRKLLFYGEEMAYKLDRLEQLMKDFTHE